MQNVLVKPPKMFWMVAILALLWNLIGVVMFAMQASMTPEALAAMPAEQQRVYAATPAWLNIVFAIAVFSGVLGAISLLMRKRWALWLFLVSLLAVVVQMVGSYVVTPIWEASGAGGLVMPMLVVLIALYLWSYAGKAERNDWID